MKNRKIAAIAIAVTILAAGALAATKQRRPNAPVLAATPTSSAPLPTKNPGQESVDVPKHIAYGLYFGEMLALKKKAQEMESKGKSAAGLKEFHKKRANLNEQETQALEQIAGACNDKVIKINDQARKIIDRERARHPHGRLKEGEQVPLPPQALKDLEEERKGVLLEAREQLRAAFGEKEFKRFDDFLQQDITARTKGGPKPKQ